MENDPSHMLMSQSTDVFKTGEPPPKSIFYCWNLRSTVLATFCIEPNNKIVEVALEFRRERKSSPPGHNFLGRYKISRHMRGKCVCFGFLSFCCLNGSSMIQMFAACEGLWPRAGAGFVLPVNICTMAASSVTDPGMYSWPIKCDVTIKSTNNFKITIVHF